VIGSRRQTNRPGPRSPATRSPANRAVTVPEAAHNGAADDESLSAAAESLATRLLVSGTSRRGRRERSQGQRIARLLEDPDGLAFVLALTDEVLRIRDPARAAGHFRALVRDAGSGRFLGPLDRLMLAGGAAAAKYRSKVPQHSQNRSKII
jgi:hypothetical protein